MKEIIVSTVSAAIKLLILALICDLTYDWTALDKIFNLSIRYDQWTGLVIIVNTLMPNGIIKEVKKNDE